MNTNFGCKLNSVFIVLGKNIIILGSKEKELKIIAVMATLPLQKRE